MKRPFSAAMAGSLCASSSAAERDGEGRVTGLLVRLTLGVKVGVLVQINAAGTISTKVPASPQAYNSAPLALAALPSADAGNIALGYIAIANNAGDWTANTDDLTDGSDLTTATFVDATEVALSAATKFVLTSESDGDIDVVITHAAGAKTVYLVVVTPSGRLVPSGAITFA